MGFGLMGFGPMAFDDVTPVANVVPVNPPLGPLPDALFWDATTRSFDQLQDGTFRPTHPVDQMVQMLLTIEQGAVPALGKVGQRYRQRLQGVPKNKQNNVALDETKIALSALLSAGDVTIKNVQVIDKIVVVAYVNNRLPNNGQPNSQTTQTARASLGVG
jgi:hypothetical protein